MNKFNEKRLGYGVENPLIKKGAKGYVSDSYKAIRQKVENNCNIMWELKDIDLSSSFPYQDEMGTMHRLFYVVEEAPLTQQYRPLNDYELVDIVGSTISYKPTGENFQVTDFCKSHLGRSSVGLRCVHTPYGYRDVNSNQLLKDYVFIDDSPIINNAPIGKEIYDV